MAEKTVRVLRAFSGINKDQESAEKTRYFTPQNADTAEDFLDQKEFDYRVEQGFLSVEETSEPEPLKFQTPTEREAQASTSTTAPAKRRRATAEE